MTNLTTAVLIIGIYGSFVAYAMHQINKSYNVRLNAWRKLGKN